MKFVVFETTLFLFQYDINGISLTLLCEFLIYALLNNYMIF